MATPFVQGRLRGEKLSAEIETSCVHCGQKLHIHLDSEGVWSVSQPGAAPLVFEPEVDWTTFTKPNIIDDY